MSYKPRILVYANYYSPDKSAMARLMTDLAEGLVDDYEVNVICAVPSYSGKIDEKYKKHRFYTDKDRNVNIIRVRVSENDKSSKKRRVLHIVDFFVNALLATIKVGRCDFVYATTAPPILGGLLGRIGKIITKAKYVYTIQDFNPEQIEAVSYSRSKQLISVLNFIDRGSCRAADGLVVIGRDMQDTLDNRFGKGKVTGQYIHNWCDEDEMYPIADSTEGVQNFKKKYGLNGKFLFMYLGNLGLYYDLIGLLTVIEKFRDVEDVAFVFVGTGAVEERMKQYCVEKNLPNVVFVPYQSGEGLLYAMNAADIHIVTNAKGIKGISVPSKIYGIMAVNKPVLGVLEKGCEVWRVIEESALGVLCETGDYQQIEKGIHHVLANRRSVVEMGAKSREVLLNKYSKQDSISKYKALLASLAAERIEK